MWLACACEGITSPKNSTGTHLELSQIGRQLGPFVGEGEGNVPIKHALPVSRVRRRFRKIDLRIVQGAAQQRQTLIPLPIANRRLLDATDGEVARDLDRARQEHVMDERSGVLDLETLFRIPESFLQVGPEGHDVVKVGELWVALDGFLCEGDRLGDAGADDKELEVEHVGEIFFVGSAPLADFLGTDRQGIGPHGERETGADEFRSAGELVDGLEAALVDGELVAGDELGEGESEFVEIAVMCTLYHRLLVFGGGTESHGGFAACGAIVDNELGKVIREATLHGVHEDARIVEQDLGIRGGLVEPYDSAERIETRMEIRAADGRD